MPLNIKVFGRPGSYYMKKVRQWLGNHKIAECHVAFNYGLQGNALRAYHARYPHIKRLPILNHQQVGNKYDHIQLADAVGVSVPHTLRKPDDPDVEWIMKPYYSLGGRDIRVRRDNEPIPKTHYVQERINNRRYEVRVHAWAWIDPKDWIFQKRVHDNGDEELAWNHHNGGRFITIDNPNDPLHERLREATKTLMKKFGYHFGAADFIIQNPGRRGEKLRHYFIEWNLAPGWTLPHIEDSYKDYFTALQELNQDQIDLLMEGIFPWEPEFIEVEEPEELQPVDLEVDADRINDFADEQIDEPDPIAVVREQLMRREQENAAWRMHQELEQRLAEEAQQPVDDDVRYAEAMAEAQQEMNFCPQCGRPVNADIFGALPRFCPGCGQRVRQ